eukprot:353562-Chlamydomonas_euryale.AAC.1
MACGRPPTTVGRADLMGQVGCMPALGRLQACAGAAEGLRWGGCRPELGGCMPALSPSALLRCGMPALLCVCLCP